MDDSDESESAAVASFTPKQNPGFDFLNQLLPGFKSVQDSGVQVYDVTGEVGDDSGVSNAEETETEVGTETETEVETETEFNDDEFEPTPEDLPPGPKMKPLNYPEQPVENYNAASEVSLPVLIGPYLNNSSKSSQGNQFVNLSDILSTNPDDRVVHNDVIPKHSGRPLVKEKMEPIDFIPDPEFTRQPNRSVQGSGQFQSEPRESQSSASQAFHKTNPFRPKTPKNSEQGADNSDQSTTPEKPSSHLEKSRVYEPARALDLLDWISPNTSITPEVVSHVEVPKLNVSNSKIFHNNPFLINKNPEGAAIAFTNAISKSKMSKSEMTTLWDYRPPTPSKFQDCEVDSGNVDALVSQVLQSSHVQGSSMTLTRVKSDHEGIQPNPETVGRRKSQFFNPGISINFNYNPAIFASDASWTWNHQKPPGSSPSAYFTTTVAASNPSNQEEQPQVDPCPTPPYLLSHDATVSEASLVPMIDSAPKLTLSVSSPDDLSPEDPPSDSDFEPPRNKPSKKSAKKSASKRNKEREELQNSPLGCRIIEILNQFNKIEEDDSGITDAPVIDNSRLSRKPSSSRNVNFGSRRTSSHAMVNRTTGSNTPMLPRQSAQSDSAVRTLGNQISRVPSKPKFEPSSYEIKRNIVLENIILAKFPRKQPSVRNIPKSISRGPSTHILSQNSKFPKSESSNVSGSSSIQWGRIQPTMTTVGPNSSQQMPSIPPRASQQLPPIPPRLSQTLPAVPPRVNRPINPDNLYRSRPLQHHYHQQSHARVENQATLLSRSRSRSRSLLNRARTDAMASRSRARIQEAQNSQARLNRTPNAQTNQNHLGRRAVSRNAFIPPRPNSRKNTNTSRVRVNIQPTQTVQIPRNGHVHVPQSHNAQVSQNRQQHTTLAAATRLAPQVPSNSQNRPRMPTPITVQAPSTSQNRSTVRRNQVNATNSVRGPNSWTRKPNSENDNV